MTTRFARCIVLVLGVGAWLLLSGPVPSRAPRDEAPVAATASPPDLGWSAGVHRVKAAVGERPPVHGGRLP